ncbi:M20/M25/M40 family metallo-hydrolase [Pectinatus sottacetonis]|uniref:M20/M25/M40 family metallo-hydrolase n=1 Tax=Pectinatus sottacetonis TaxID=1002795 RepID=UPI0018C7D9D4|nr:M20/M25/M40 family metallo-hydrolase [Pectinatus sottacetonis]
MNNLQSKSDLSKEILELTKQLVAIPSINSAGEGEKNVACFIEKYLRDFPYFQKHPEQIIIQKLKNDKLDRRNVFALIRGEKEKSADTILLHGHIDTVGVDDYGSLKPYAFSPDKLMEKLSEMNLSDEVRTDLESGDYLFGRGACDMKSGDAVFLVLARLFCEQAANFGGNILLSFNPVEENIHTGIIDGLEVLTMLQEKEQLHYLFAINNDYICPLYPNDHTRYVYTGAVGKLLPCFYVHGKETHVGQCFEGFDASLTAAELIRIINLNCDFCDEYRGEFTLPPSVLKMKDLKSSYNVQTAVSAFVYFNYFIHNMPINKIIDKLKSAAMQALVNVQDHLNNQYKTFCKLSHVDYQPFAYNLQVLTYDELYTLAGKNYAGDLDSLLNEIVTACGEKDVDKREIPLQMAQKLCDIAKINDPAVILFFAAPYCPHNTIHEEDPQQNALFGKLSDTIAGFAEKSGEHYEIKQFFQSLSDSSYLTIDDDDASIDALLKNFPAFSILHPVPLKKIKKLGIPAINYGCFGKDAHKWTERVYMPYSFGVLPDFIKYTIKSFLKF